MAVLLCWCLASAFWSAEPAVVFRRAGLEVVIVTALCFSVDILGAERAFRIWRWLLAGVLLTNFLSIPLVPAARHLAGASGDAGLIGDWRGLYGHKNIAGAVCAITAILFLFARMGWRNWIGIAVAAAACVFLVMTRSKTSLGLLPLAVAAGLAYRIFWRDGLSRAVLAIAGLLLLAAAILLAVMDGDMLRHLLEDPQEFTGRTAIWTAELSYIHDHPLLGSGFGTFADSGGLSPLHNYAGGAWVEGAAHGHDGYLQLLVTIGGIGFALAMLALVIEPLRRFWALDWDEDGFKPMLFALFIFLILHNVMESDFLEGDSVTWAALVLVIAALANRDHKSLTGSF
jgi:O-antigen ligase